MGVCIELKKLLAQPVRGIWTLAKEEAEALFEKTHSHCSLVGILVV